MEQKFELSPELQDASLEKACKMAQSLTHTAHMSRDSVEGAAADLHYMLEYLRLNFDLVAKKEYFVSQKSKLTICSSCNLDISKNIVCMSVACPYQIKVTCSTSDNY